MGTVLQPKLLSLRLDKIKCAMWSKCAIWAVLHRTLLHCADLPLYRSLFHVTFFNMISQSNYVSISFIFNIIIHMRVSSTNICMYVWRTDAPKQMAPEISGLVTIEVRIPPGKMLWKLVVNEENDTEDALFAMNHSQLGNPGKSRFCASLVTWSL